MEPYQNVLLWRLLQNSIWSQICAFNVEFEFFANRLWPVGYVNLRKNEPTSKSSNLALKASFAKASLVIGDMDLRVYFCLRSAAI
jgi:hypothetical protein